MIARLYNLYACYYGYSCAYLYLPHMTSQISVVWSIMVNCLKVQCNPDNKFDLHKTEENWSWINTNNWFCIHIHLKRVHQYFNLKKNFEGWLNYSAQVHFLKLFDWFETQLNLVWLKTNRNYLRNVRFLLVKPNGICFYS